IAWDSGRMGMGYRTRRRGDYLLALQKPPLRAKATWRDHSIPDRWAEKVDRKIHPHVKACRSDRAAYPCRDAAGGFGHWSWCRQLRVDARRPSPRARIHRL